MPTKEREAELRKQVFLNKHDIAEIEGCSIDGAEKIMTNMRRWKKQNERKIYPRGHVLADDFFNHFWLVLGNRDVKKRYEH